MKWNVSMTCVIIRPLPCHDDVDDDFENECLADKSAAVARREKERYPPKNYRTMNLWNFIFTWNRCPTTQTKILFPIQLPREDRLPAEFSRQAIQGHRGSRVGPRKDHNSLWHINLAQPLLLLRLPTLDGGRITGRPSVWQRNMHSTGLPKRAPTCSNVKND